MEQFSKYWQKNPKVPRGHNPCPQVPRTSSQNSWLLAEFWRNSHLPSRWEGGLLSRLDAVTYSGEHGVWTCWTLLLPSCENQNFKESSPDLRSKGHILFGHLEMREGLCILGWGTSRIKWSGEWVVQFRVYEGERGEVRLESDFISPWPINHLILWTLSLKCSHSGWEVRIWVLPVSQSLLPLPNPFRLSSSLWLPLQWSPCLWLLPLLNHYPYRH